MLSYKFSNNVFQNIKNYNNPENIIKIIKEEGEPTIMYDKICKEDQIKYQKKDSENFEKLIICIKYFQEKLVPEIKNDITLYFIIGYLLENKFNICIDTTIYNYQNRCIHKEAFTILNENPQYIPHFINTLALFCPYNIVVLLVPSFTGDTSLLSIIQPETLRYALKFISINHKMRRITLLTDMLKIILTNNYNRNLSDVIIECYHDMAVNNFFRYEYFWEIGDILEWSVTSPKLFEKLISIDLNESDIYYLEKYGEECMRLCKEFDRVLKHPTLSEYSQIFYKNEIERLTKINKYIGLVNKRISMIKTIKINNSAKIIQNAWYNHIERICHPNHPKMQERLLISLSEINNETKTHK